MSDEKVEPSLRDRMIKFADAYIFFGDQAQFASLDENQKVKLFELFLKRLEVVKNTQEPQSKSQTSDQDKTKPTDRQFSMLKRLQNGEHLIEDEVGELSTLTRKQVSDLIALGLKREKEAKEMKPQTSSSFGGSASL